MIRDSLFVTSCVLNIGAVLFLDGWPKDNLIITGLALSVLALVLKPESVV